VLGRAADRIQQSLPVPAREAIKSSMHVYGRLTAGSRVLPDFLIVGTKRGGTTSLWNYLLQHPLVAPMVPAREKIKSPHYFYWHFDKGPAWYRSHFVTARRLRRAGARSGGQAVAGEASPYYLFHPETPQRASRLVPGAKIVILLRDPVKRAYSHYWERVGQGVEPLSFEDALAAEPDRLSGETERMAADPFYYSRAHDWYSYRSRGVYLPQVRRWLEAFPAEQVLILRSEDLFHDAQRLVDEVTAFLGLPPVPVPVVDRWNYLPAEPMAAATRRELVDYYAQHNVALEAALGRTFGWTGGN
jgi:hypothetical protein